MPDNLLSGMAQPILVPNMVVVLEALDPDSGTDNTDVVISDVVISGTPSADIGGDVTSGPFMLVPGPVPTVAA